MRRCGSRRSMAFLSNTGALVVARRSADSFQLEKKYELSASETWARPVITNGDLIVRDATSLNRLTGK